eukprot:2977323-Rhodomonas_salina.1
MLLPARRAVTPTERCHCTCMALTPPSVWYRTKHVTGYGASVWYWTLYTGYGASVLYWVLYDIPRAYGT